MATSSLALVLGAGASKAYGYPLGGELRDLIINMSSTQAIRHGVIQNNSESERKHLHEFQNAFNLSALYSIDAFLGRRREFEKIGKNCIAAILLEREDPRVLMSGSQDHWYQYLLNEISVDSWDELDFSTLSIITFNYDRSLEMFLLQSLTNGYGRNEAEVAEKLKTLRIVHVYGSLGTAVSKRDISAYDGSVGRDKIVTAAQHLKVIPEGRMNSDTLVTAREWLSQAHHIAFLGFGFDKTNVERLAENGACERQIQLREKPHVREIIATCIGLRALEIRDAFESLTNTSYKPFAVKDPPFRGVKCYDLLRDSLFLRK